MRRENIENIKKVTQHPVTKYSLIAILSAGITLISFVEESLVKTVDIYCSTLKQDIRKVIRDRVNTKFKPNSIVIHCEKDGVEK